MHKMDAIFIGENRKNVSKSVALELLGSLGGKANVLWVSKFLSGCIYTAEKLDSNLIFLPTCNSGRLFSWLCEQCKTHEI